MIEASKEKERWKMQEISEMGAVIAERRRILGMTQQELAKKLGITFQAVSKWENRQACPDVGILPALARILGTDLNRLFGFQEEMPEEELQAFLKELMETARREGMARGFAMGQEKIREYPGCGRLAYMTATVLQGILVMSGLHGEERERHMEQAYGLYEQVVHCSDEQAKQGAAYMLASRYTQQGDYARAEEMLSLIPKYNGRDKRLLEANLLIEQKEYAKAGELLERKLLNSANDMQMTLARLMELSILEGQGGDAQYLSDTIREFVRLLGLWEYGSYAFTLENALSRQNVAECTALLQKMFEAALRPWDMKKTPLYRHIATWKKDEEYGFKALPALLASVEYDEKFAFLRESEEVRALLDKYHRLLDENRPGSL